MKKKSFNLVAILLIAGFSNNLMAQNTATDAAAAFATIIAPITITKSADLNFGDVIDGTGTVTLDTAGARTSDYQAFAGSQIGTVSAASFAITGQGTYTYAITVPTTDVTLTAVGEATMIVNAFVASSSDGLGLTGTLSSGTDNVIVGATLNVIAGQEIGLYTGTFDVTVAYN